MTTFTLARIAEILAPLTTSATISEPDRQISRLLTDSRSLIYPESTLFFAIATERGDGSRYIADLYHKGVRAFVTSRKPEPAMPGASYIVVNDPLLALQTLGAANRALHDHPKVIAVTGSTGKTTVKEMLYQLLGHDHAITRSPRSFNSQIGVPLSLWQIERTDDIAIIEAGISREGEMATLADMIRPTIGILTNIGLEHASGFVSQQAKLREKLRLFTGCDTVIYDADSTPASELRAAGLPDTVAIAGWSRKGAPEATLTVANTITNPVFRSTSLSYVWRGSDEHTITVPFTEQADIDNALTCLTVLCQLGVSYHDIAVRMARLCAVDTRLDVMEGVGGSLLIRDSFTSDIQSLPSALDFLNRRRTYSRSTTVILSDLVRDARSLSPSALYSEAADLLRRFSIDRIVGVGKEIAANAAAFVSWGDNATFYHDVDTFIAEAAPESFQSQLILVKGAPTLHFDHIADHLEARQHETVLEVNLDAVVDNFNWFRSKLKPSTGIVCMIKASGYGAGAVEIAKTLQTRGAAYVAVAVVDEGVQLRNAGITMPIMVMNPKVANYRTMFAHRLEPEVYSFDLLADILDSARRCGEHDFPIHIKFDTGMHRLGFRLEDLDRLAAILLAPENVGLLRPASVFSHLSVADCPNEDAYTQMQFDYFEEASRKLRSLLPDYDIKRHILNSTGIVRFPEHQYDMVRLGIGLYGVATTDDGSEEGLRPVSALYTSVIAVHDWEPGTTVGYGRCGRLTRPSRVATLPVGYADGIDRHLGRGAMSVWISGHRCPTVGNICMDACMVDVTDLPSCRPGDRVEIFGPHVPAAELADILGTIPYEILTSVSERVKRVYYRE